MAQPGQAPADQPGQAPADQPGPGVGPRGRDMSRDGTGPCEDGGPRPRKVVDLGPGASFVGVRGQLRAVTVGEDVERRRGSAGVTVDEAPAALVVRRAPRGPAGAALDGEVAGALRRLPENALRHLERRPGR